MLQQTKSSNHLVFQERTQKIASVRLLVTRSARGIIRDIISYTVCEGYNTGYYWFSKKYRIGRGLLGLARRIAFI